MQNIIVTKRDGTTYPLARKRTATAIKSAKQTWELLGNDVVNITIESPFKQVYNIGDTITVFGRVYRLNRLPHATKTGMHANSYDLEFEGVQYDLIRVTYDLTIDTTNNELQEIQADSLCGDLRTFANVLISNTNRVFPDTWVLGSCPDTIEDKTLVFGESDNCLNVLYRLCEEFGVEVTIEQADGVFTINFVETVGGTFPFTFQFGKGKGLYFLDRQNVDSSNIITRLKVFGSTQNITNKYRSTRLCLPNKSKGESYIEKAAAVAKYGIYEARKDFNDIKPTFDGSITGLVSGNILKFKDTKMFDLNALEPDGVTTKYLMPGVTAKIHFNTGQLAGYEFEIQEKGGYDHATKTFTIVQQEDENGNKFPSSTSSAFQLNVGDKYKILDVALPNDPYVTDAEAKLAEDADTYYDQNSQPKVQYGLSVTKAFLEKTYQGDGTTVNIFRPGDYIPVKDDDIDVDKSVRIKSLVRDLLDEYDYQLVISDTVSTNITNRVISDLIDQDKVLTMNNLKDPAKSRANWRSSREVMNMVFDPEGDYYTEKIKPNSIDTQALAVGAKSMQFGLAGTVFQPNYGGNKNVIKVQGGVLTHYTIDDDTSRNWTLADNTTTLNTDEQAYYIYAKCERSGSAGSIIFSTEQIKVSENANFYHFPVGVVNSVDTELKARSIALTYGFSMINGRFIKTGRIESSGGSGSYFDLDENQFRIGNESKGLSWNENGDGKLKLKGTMVQSPSGEEFPVTAFRGAYSSATPYYKGDEITYGGSSWRYINNTSSSGRTPTEGSYWTKVSAKGDTGASGQDGAKGDKGDTGAKGDKGDSPALVFRGNYDSSATYYGNSMRVDAVKYGSTYYVAKTNAGTFSGTTPPGTKWVNFGASFESVATGLLLAERAVINNLAVKELMTSEDGQRITINENGNNAMKFYVPNEASAVGTIDDDINVMGVGQAPGVEFRNDDGYSQLTSSGIFANGCGINAIPSTAGYDIRASIVGLGFANFNKSYFGDGFVAGVYGRASNSGNAPEYGGYFNGIKANGLNLGAKVYTSYKAETLGHYTTMVVAMNGDSSNCRITLPSENSKRLNAGHTIFFLCVGGRAIDVFPNTSQILLDDNSPNENIAVDGNHRFCVFVYTGKKYTSGTYSGRSIWAFRRC